MKFAAVALATLLTLSPVAAFGHAPPVGAHGGMQVHAGPLHQELVIKDKVLTVYMNTMEDKPIDTAGATGSVTLLIDGAPVQVILTPAGSNSLSGKIDRDVPVGTRIATVVTLAGKGPVQARYEWKPAAAGGEHAGH
ncbi:hypothetical protein CHU95_14540 [Niveispirillum lacus]|uniref:Copper-binding protein n=1 Tax=Niveispirillum lacus TaxID=1981099 RepID=A0A255YWI1_9PROT|nr:hypothetical protein [Niveispirillum lacus]OYQ33593.1 hypothetical protein CHU95_14540 [Niveispirillum lacus]